MKTPLPFIFVLVFAAACGGQTVGDLDGGTDAAKTDGDTFVPACTKNSDCGKGVCGFAESEACSAKGQCFAAPGPLCNSFKPGCSCNGDTINIVCNGMPDGFAPAPLAHTGDCTTPISDGGAPGYSCGTTTCIPGQDICYFPANVSDPGTCMPANGCSDCKCAQAMFQCVSSCKQNGADIYIQCQ